MDNKEFYFKDPFFRLGLASQFFIKNILQVFFIVLVFACFIFLMSDAPNLFYVGVLIFIFIVDFIIRYDRGRLSLDQIPQEGKINLKNYLSPKASEAIIFAYQETLILGGSFYLRLNKTLFDFQEINEAIQRMEIKPAKVFQRISEALKDDDEKNSTDDLIQKIEELLKVAVLIAIKGGSRYIMPADIFAAQKYIQDKKIIKIFNFFQINLNDLEGVIIFSRFRKHLKKEYILWQLPKFIGGFANVFFGARKRTMNRAWTARPTSFLDKFSYDLTDSAERGESGFMVGHTKEYERMINVLSRPDKPNVIFVGEPGVGIKTIINHLAYMIIKDRISETLFDKRVVALDIGKLLSGADQTELQARINIIFKEISAAGNIILYVPEIHNLFKTSGELYLSAADLISPLLISGDFPTIGTTYPQEFRQFIKPNSNFAQAFEFIMVEEISEEDSTIFLTFSSLMLEKQYHIFISSKAVKAAVYIAKRYFHQKPLPGSAGDLLKEAVISAKRQGFKKLTADFVVETAESYVNVPIHKPTALEAEKLLNLENIIHQELINQEEAVIAVSRALREYRSGLSRKGGPIACFLFVGPTGVGKTELAKILTKINFGSEEMMIRLDMSEYQNKESLYRLIGSPKGEVIGLLTEAVLEKPYSLVLLDEFEKAHPDILNLFLQVFDDGRLTDSSGRKVDFQNTIIAATSNAHSDFIKTSLEAGKNIEEIKEEFKRKLVDCFRTELLNRFSDIIIFKTLSKEDIKKITFLQLKKICFQLKEEQSLELFFGDDVVEHLSEVGYDSVFGARPLRKAISNYLKAPLAEKILKGEIMKGDSIMIKTDAGKILFLKITL